MADMTLEVNVTGAETLDNDFKAALTEIGQAIVASAQDVIADMKDALKRHIEKDVYEAYTPKEYPRRSENNRFGIPLNDTERNVSPIQPSGKVDFSGIDISFGLNYKPDGTHSGTTADLPVHSQYYNADNPKPIKPKPVHGDDLIRRIETGRGYDWNVHVPKREFWQKFVGEMVDQKEAERYFVAAMRMQGIDIVEDGAMTRNSNDGDY